MEDREGRVADLDVTGAAIAAKTPDDQHQADRRYQRVESFVGAFAQSADHRRARRAQRGEGVDTEEKDKAQDQDGHRLPVAYFDRRLHIRTTFYGCVKTHIVLPWGSPN